MKTINCRDDSLVDDRGMWTTMKKKKRCVVVAQGFYEWLKKGSQKVPHFTKRKDGQLMCLAGLWDMVQFEGAPRRCCSAHMSLTATPRLERAAVHVLHHHHRLEQTAQLPARPHARHPRQRLRCDPHMA
jgi:putative SOS response-associated peptidase YedK